MTCLAKLCDGRPVVRHCHDRVGWRDRALDRVGGIGVGHVDLGIGLRIGGCCRGGIGGSLFLKLVELLLHQNKLSF
jgi:hypothetical protein